MITRIRIERFKGFASVEVPFGGLTLLTGLNSAGKTSVIQALLLARQVLRGESTVRLNTADGLSLGEPVDVLHRGRGAESISLALTTAGGMTEWQCVLEAPDDRAMHLNATSVDVPPKGCNLAMNEPDFTYLCAERNGPRDALPAYASDAAALGVGVQGERCAQVLALHDRREVHPARRAPAAAGGAAGSDQYLPKQCEIWLSRVLGTPARIEIDARWLNDTATTVLRFRPPGTGPEWTRPANLGFGVSYMLPILVAGLIAREGGLLIVENPEAHLHPAGQSEIGRFLAQVASSGVQVVLETHSDHVVNGVRRAVAERSVELDGSDVSVLFFRSGQDGPSFDRIDLRNTGELSSWPVGFFDQLDGDLAAIARARRARPRS